MILVMFHIYVLEPDMNKYIGRIMYKSKGNDCSALKIPYSPFSQGTWNTSLLSSGIKYKAIYGRLIIEYNISWLKYQFWKRDSKEPMSFFDCNLNVLLTKILQTRSCEESQNKKCPYIEVNKALLVLPKIRFTQIVYYWSKSIGTIAFVPSSTLKQAAYWKVTFFLGLIAEKTKTDKVDGPISGDLEEDLVSSWLGKWAQALWGNGVAGWLV